MCVSVSETSACTVNINVIYFIGQDESDGRNVYEIKRKITEKPKKL